MLNSDSAKLRSYGLLALRLGIGAVLIAHGYAKFFKMGLGGVAGFMGHLGVPLPMVAALWAATAEFVGGIAMILGIFTLPFGLMAAVDLAGAIFFAKRHSPIMGPNSYELELCLLVGSLAVALAGPGALALGSLLRRKGSSPDRS